MALSSPTCSIYILLSKFLFFDVSLTSILLKRNLQMIFPSISAWVWVVLFLFFSTPLCYYVSFFLQQLLTSILAVFWDLGICDLIDTFKDVQKVQYAFYDLFQYWYLQDYKALRKIADLGISLKRHVFVDNCQCSEFLKYISQVLR